jgi:G:T/U-mismatch repair DNA glycosylase
MKGEPLIVLVGLNKIKGEKMRVKHKFLDKYPIKGKKILIIGTFNPDVECNDAKFFYGRSKNYFWDLLPKVFGYKSLKKESVGEKIAFLEKYEIELTDLICEVELLEEDICNYSDENLKKDIVWNTENIIKILRKGNTKEVYFTRKTFNCIKNIEKEIKKIENFCKKHNIKFEYLPTPARYINEKKLNEWREKFLK